jgi:hypothetical protein
MFEK